ncbi:MULTISPECIES: cytosine permease [unclassified Microbacterium]|uniref:purine-cytosine permease family protein n=1 Tax=unclassified Microbacterium TaxID=2609290 RepID=UPI000EAA9ABB|nr:MULTISPECIES: cytosine permease [unclassified Microbacterium]MBT2486379.1 cytosine permease [Microbacterium sp. ISL-108]RKN69086.1 nitrate reductase [Microbacterium sp. CGR2]
MTQPAPVVAEHADAPTHPETRGIELIGDAERHGRARDLFLIWAAPNVSILNLTIGASLILLGLEIWQAIAVILAASVLWVFPGIVAGSGPAAGTSGSVVTRAMYGILGNRLFVAFVGWFIGAVFLSLTWLASSFMGADLLRRAGMDDPVWVPIGVTVVVAAITILVAIFGHGLILRAYPYMAGALLVIFLAVAGFILPTVDWQYSSPVPLEGAALWSAVTIGFTILASTPLSFINSPDIARYLPRDTKPSHIAAATAFGGAVPFIVFTTVGVLLATGLSVDAYSAGIDVALLDLLPVWLGPVLVVGVVINTIALNAMTAYTSSMALQAIGFRLRRIPAAIIVGVVGTALTIYLVLSSNLVEAANLMLQFLVIVSGPAMAIFAVDVVLRRYDYDGVELFEDRQGGRFWYSAGWSIPGLTALFLGGVATALCLSTSVWSGPVAQATGYVDLSVPVGMVVAAGVYAGLLRTSLGKEGRP